MRPIYTNVLSSIVDQYTEQIIENIMGTSLALHPDFLNISHNGQVKYFRKNFKEYSKEEFRDMSNDPMVKEILQGSVKLSKEQIVDRIKEHLDNMNNNKEDIPKESEELDPRFFMPQMIRPGISPPHSFVITDDMMEND